MKKVLLATVVAIAFAAVAPAFASPSEEAEGDYEGWRAAQAAAAQTANDAQRAQTRHGHIIYRSGHAAR